MYKKAIEDYQTENEYLKKFHERPVEEFREQKPLSIIAPFTSTS